MNSFERVMNALSGKPVDRPPVLAVLGAYGGRITGTPLTELYTQADAYVAGQQAIISTFGTDMALAPFDYSVLSEAFGGETAFFDQQPPNMKRPGMSKIGEALTCPLPDPYQTGRLPFVLDCTRKLAALCHKTVPVFAALPGPAALPMLMLGLETWLETLLFDETAARQILKRSGPFWVSWANALLEAGADALVVTEGMAAATITTRDIFQEKCLPHIRACFAEVKGPLVFHHTGGPLNHVIDLLPGLPNLIGIAVSSKDDLYEAREKAGPGIALLGNLDNLTFRAVSAETIRTMATACLKAGAELAPLILCNSGADLPVDTPPENIHALREASERFAGLPIPPETLWICCGVARAEIEELHRRGAIRGKLCFLCSMLHMDPLKLEGVLDDALNHTTQPVVLIYGDCCPGMLQLAAHPGVCRTDGINCCQLLLGKQRYRELMHADSFMLLPEWAHRWREIIEQELGLREKTAHDFFKDTRRELVYLDTGLKPVPEADLLACAKYTGLPLRIETTGLDHLKTALLEAETTARKGWRSTP